MKAEEDELTQRRIKILVGLAKGDQAIKEGKVMTHEEVKKSLSKWLEPNAGNSHP